MASYAVAAGFLAYHELKRSSSFSLTPVTSIAAVGVVFIYVFVVDAQVSRAVFSAGSLAALACLVAFLGFPCFGSFRESVC